MQKWHTCRTACLASSQLLKPWGLMKLSKTFTQRQLVQIWCNHGHALRQLDTPVCFLEACHLLRMPCVRVLFQLQFRLLHSCQMTWILQCDSQQVSVRVFLCTRFGSSSALHVKWKTPTLHKPWNNTSLYHFRKPLHFSSQQDTLCSGLIMRPLCSVRRVHICLVRLLPQVFSVKLLSVLRSLCAPPLKLPKATSTNLLQKVRRLRSR